MFSFIVQPRNLLSPAALSPNGGDAEVNPFESEFNGHDDEEDDEFDLATPPPDEQEQEHNNFAVLNSSLPESIPRATSSHLCKCTARVAGRQREEATSDEMALRHPEPKPAHGSYA